MNEEREDWLRFVKEAEVDGRSFFILKNEADELRVVEADEYRHYRLVEGQRLRARVRKRGCAGEEITELMHPVYHEGDLYPMTVVRCGKLNFGGQELPFAAVLDPFGDEYILERNPNQTLSLGSRVNCCLVEQRRGRLSFQLVSI